MRRRIVLFFTTLLVGTLAVTVALADKPIVLRSLTVNDFSRVVISTLPNGTSEICSTYRIKDTSGMAITGSRIHCRVLTASQLATYKLFLQDTGLVPGANLQEGMP